MEIHFEKDYGSIMLTPALVFNKEDKYIIVGWLFWGIIINF